MIWKQRRKAKQDKKELRARIYRPTPRGEVQAAWRARTQAAVTLAVVLLIALGVACAVLLGRSKTPEVSAEPTTTEPPAAAFTVVLDPGHGGDDPGAPIDTETSEADYALACARAARDALEAQGCAVVFSHEGEGSSDPARLDRLNDAGGDCVISIHTCGTAGAGYSLLSDTTEYSRLLAEAFGNPYKDAQGAVACVTGTPCVRLTVDAGVSAQGNARVIADAVAAYRKKVGK